MACPTKPAGIPILGDRQFGFLQLCFLSGHFNLQSHRFLRQGAFRDVRGGGPTIESSALITIGCFFFFFFFFFFCVKRKYYRLLQGPWMVLHCSFIGIIHREIIAPLLQKLCWALHLFLRGFLLFSARKQHWQASIDFACVNFEYFHDRSQRPGDSSLAWGKKPYSVNSHLPPSICLMSAEAVRNLPEGSLI